MSGAGTLEMDWGDGRHRFRFAFDELRELQSKTGCGPLVVLKRLRDGTWLVDDIAETLRIGLIGGGLKPVEALRLIRRYVYDRAPAENLTPALLVLSAGLFGPADDPVGKAPAPAEATETEMEQSPSPPSSEPAP